MLSSGLTYYIDELRRRDNERAEAANYELARRAHWLAVATSALPTVSAIAAIIAIVAAL